MRNQQAVPYNKQITASDRAGNFAEAQRAFNAALQAGVADAVTYRSFAVAITREIERAGQAADSQRAQRTSFFGAIQPSQQPPPPPPQEKTWDPLTALNPFQIN